MSQNSFRALLKKALGGASVLLGLYFGLAPRVAKGLYINLLFHPNPYPKGDYETTEIDGVPYQDVYFEAGDGTVLHGWFFGQTGSRFTVLLSHGNTGNISERPALLQAILRTGASLFVYDYRGFGRSKGNLSLRGAIDDACAAFDYLVEKRVCGPERIVLYGESLGAAISCQLSLRRWVRAMILQSAFSSITSISKHHFPFMRIYPQSLFPRPLLDNAAVLRRGNHPPVLLVHGHKDPVVPFAHGLELFENAVDKKVLVDFPEAAHSDIPLLAQDRFVAVMKDFLGELG